MPYDTHLADRIRDWVEGRPHFTEKHMFGGIGFFLHGNMCCGVWHESLVLRVGKDAWEDYLEQDDVSEFDITGRSLTGWVLVAPDGIDTLDQLEQHLDAALCFAWTLPPKT